MEPNENGNFFCPPLYGHYTYFFTLVSDYEVQLKLKNVFVIGYFYTLRKKFAILSFLKVSPT